MPFAVSTVRRCAYDAESFKDGRDCPTSDNPADMFPRRQGPVSSSTKTWVNWDLPGDGTGHPSVVLNGRAASLVVWEKPRCDGPDSRHGLHFESTDKLILLFSAIQTPLEMHSEDFKHLTLLTMFVRQWKCQRTSCHLTAWGHWRNFGR